MEPVCRTDVSSRGSAIVHRIVTAVAGHEQCDVLDPSPLSESVDPDALGQVVTESDVTEIGFPYQDRRVSIDGGGCVGVAHGE